MIRPHGDRFADKIHHMRLMPELEPAVLGHSKPAELLDMARNFVKARPVFVVDTAAVAAFREIGSDGKGMPRLVHPDSANTVYPYRTPYPGFWIEYVMPSFIDPSPGRFVGAMVLDDSQEDDMLVLRWEDAMRDIPREQRDLIDFSLVKRRISMQVFTSYGSTVMPMGSIMLFTDKHGQHLGAATQSRELTREVRHGFTDALDIHAAPIVMGLAMLTGRGFQQRDVYPDRQRSERRQRRNKLPPLVRYRELLVDLDRWGRGRNAGETTPGSGVGVAEHMVRGNEAVYTSAAPLFGHFVGVVWRESYKKGNRTHGRIEKDYRLGDSVSRPGQEVP